jgi:hypothetical protein
LIVERRCCEAEFRRRLSDENRNGVFELRALDGDVRVFDAGGVQLGLCLRNVGLRSHTPFEAIERELQVVGIGFYGIVEKLFLSVGAAQLEIVQSEFRLETELCGFVVGSGRLRLLASGGDAAPHTSPKVQLVGKIEGQLEIALAGLLDLRRKVRRKVRTLDIAGARRSGDGRKLRSPIEANGCSSFAEVRFRYFQVLVGTGDLLFQLVELRIAKNFPPVSAARLIPGTRGLPLV